MGREGGREGRVDAHVLVIASGHKMGWAFIQIESALEDEVNN